MPFVWSCRNTYDKHLLDTEKEYLSFQRDKMCVYTHINKKVILQIKHVTSSYKPQTLGPKTVSFFSSSLISKYNSASCTKLHAIDSSNDFCLVKENNKIYFKVVRHSFKTKQIHFKIEFRVTLWLIKSDVYLQQHRLIQDILKLNCGHLLLGILYYHLKYILQGYIIF